MQDDSLRPKLAECIHEVEAMDPERQRAKDTDQRTQALVRGVAVEGRVTKDQIAKPGLAFFDLKGDLATPNASITLECHRGEVLARLIGADLESPGQTLLACFPGPLQFEPVRHVTVGAGRAVPSFRTVVAIACRGTQHLDGALNPRADVVRPEIQDAGLGR